MGAFNRKRPATTSASAIIRVLIAAGKEIVLCLANNPGPQRDLLMSERREYFRMPMEAELELKQLEEEPAEGAEPANEFPAQSMLKIMTELKRLDGDAAQLHPQIKDSDRALGEYLHIISRKIDVLAQY